MDHYLESLEEMLFSTLSSTEEALNQLWLDFTRYGPSLPQVRVPGIEFEVPAPPPPPAPKSFVNESLDWVERHPWRACGILSGIIGTGLLAGYTRAYIKASRIKKIKAMAAERRQAVVVLGGDSPFGLPLITDLEKKGFIVITTVSTPEAVDIIESKCQGYVHALVLDPAAPETIPVFFRSLSATLNRKFPLTSAGDPFVSPASQPYIHSVVSLLTLSAPVLHAPLEHISFEDSYIPYLNATQITPLTVIQWLLPMMRIGPAHGKKTIIFCLPATETRVGLPFSAMQTMSAASTLRAAEVLRREIRAAATTGKSEFVKNLKVVIVDVGIFDVNTPASLKTLDVFKSTEKWTSSEKLTYGPAFTAIAYSSSAPAQSDWNSFWSILNDSHQYGVPRKPTPTHVFVDSITGVVSNGNFGPSIFGLRLGIGRFQNWVRGERFSIGAGAQTYKLASFLPSLILDSLLNLPHFLISIRNSLLPTQPFVRPPSTTAHLPTSQRAIEAPPPVTTDSDPDESSHSDNGSEADVESNSGDGTTADSWISLPKSHDDEQKE